MGASSSSKSREHVRIAREAWLRLGGHGLTVEIPLGALRRAARGVASGQAPHRVESSPVPIASIANTETTLRDVEAAARAMGLQIQVLNAGTSREIEAAFATFVVERRDALYVGNDPFFNSRRVQMVHLASYHRIPATYSSRDFAEAGGLMSYGSNITDAWRLAGAYAGRILKGAKPADLPAVQSSKFELVINTETARMLGLIVPDKLLVAADEVIE
jgi:putative ABC transport system substrate-binding protein